MLEKKQVLQLLDEAGLGDYRTAFEPFVKPSIRLHTAPMNDQEAEAGSSKLAGLPDVPKDFVWPKWENVPLTFVGQIDLGAIDKSVLDRYGCPSEGVLSFFYAFESRFEGEEDEASAVYYFPKPAVHPVEPSELPELLSEQFRYPGCGLRFDVEWTIPGPETSEISNGLQLGWGKNQEDYDRYWNTFLPSVGELLNARTPRHRFLGNHDPVQSGYRREGYALLLQIDDASPFPQWMPDGSLYFWIKPEALAKLDFSEVYVSWECT